MSDGITDMHREEEKKAIEKLPNWCDEVFNRKLRESNANSYDGFGELTEKTECLERERTEMLSLLEDCLSEIKGDCIASCDHVGTPDCMNDCDTYNLKERIQTTIKKAKGE